ncbi:MAG: Crp/Fnr family transcriptional regulator [Methylocystis sp.]|uniref:Cyclic nucleotide-binding domain-containing protein n=1 Tax=Methylocystis rosea TaxID=173366 RepID=A0A3G8M5H8_9HYPH|nr:cyclic nucleotide-binding domain-containing protein [Methylocystis rosea]AZG76138.1 cyclic nucleotide-binding domain-containing protein [Methylocystis rosea]PPD05725.1 MAG: Crp/Fnr family transcriptional regulator [Methylocystis sp.]
MKDIADLLRHHPFAEGLDEETLALIAGCAKNVILQPGEYFLREAAPADSFYLVRHGAVALETFVPGRGPFTFLTVKSGEILGAEWLIPPYRSSFDARAVELTRAISFDGKCLRGKCEADPRVGYEMMKRFIPPLVKRLQSARMQALGMYDAANA